MQTDFRLGFLTFECNQTIIWNRKIIYPNPHTIKKNYNISCGVIRSNLRGLELIFNFIYLQKEKLCIRIKQNLKTFNLKYSGFFLY